jgi:hypothetical protein
VRYADEENQPLESVREPQPGDIPSFPPRKKPRLLGPATEDDDVPEANKMVFSPKPAWQGGMSENADGAEEDDEAPASQASETSQASQDEDDEFARLLHGMVDADG